MGDAGPQLDELSIESYTGRLEDLRSELQEAEAGHDLGRAERLRDELAAISKELAGGVGRGGKARVAASATNRARVAVTKTIRSAIRRIEDEHRELGAHLDRAIRTGVFCSYEPDPALGIRWRLGRS